MININDFSSNFSIASYDVPASKKDIEELKDYSSIQLPIEYIDLMYHASEIEISVRNKKYIRIWSPQGCIEMNQGYAIQEYIPGSLGIGDDEGGNVIIYVTGNNGFGVYLVSLSNLDMDDAEFIAPSLSDLLIRDEGIEKLMLN